MCLKEIFVILKLSFLLIVQTLHSIHFLIDVNVDNCIQTLFISLVALGSSHWSLSLGEAGSDDLVLDGSFLVKELLFFKKLLQSCRGWWWHQLYSVCSLLLKVVEESFALIERSFHRLNTWSLPVAIRPLISRHPHVVNSGLW